MCTCDPDVCFHCGDCGVDTWAIAEYYSVRPKLWRRFGNRFGMLCVSCLEARMGRLLRPLDFTDFPINLGVFPQSDRLLDRLGRKNAMNVGDVTVGWHVRDRVLYSSGSRSEMLRLESALGTGTVRHKSGTVWQWRTRVRETPAALARLEA